MIYVLAYVFIGVVIGRISARHDFKADIADGTKREKAEKSAIKEFFIVSSFWPIALLFLALVLGVEGYERHLQNSSGFVRKALTRAVLGKVSSNDR